jgi:hypothetical protein
MSFARRAIRIALVLAVAAVVVPVPAVRADGGGATLYRIFLNAGGSLVSYGEFVRLDDRVVFSLPLGAAPEEPELHLVTIPADEVNWPNTEQYAHSARYDQYVATRAEADFSTMSAAVARALNEIALAPDPARRLQLATEARGVLEAWPRTHLGYRAADIRQIVNLLDEIVAELRVAAGMAQFDLNLVAFSDPPPRMPLADPPTLRDSILQALRAARLTPSPAERLSLLQAAVAIVDRSGDRLPAPWARATRRVASEALAEETRVEQQYAEWSKTVLARATERAAAADVRAVEEIVRDVDRADARLGRRRPEVVRSTRLAVEGRLDAARRLRLARDQWTLRRAAFQRYAGIANDPVDLLVDAGPWLDDIKALAGPDRDALSTLQRGVARALRQMSAAKVPSGLEGVHANLTSALRFADTAARMRTRAVVSGDLSAAWDASSAAAAAMMLVGQVRDDLERALKIPEVR